VCVGARTRHWAPRADLPSAPHVVGGRWRPVLFPQRLRQIRTLPQSDCECDLLSSCLTWCSLQGQLCNTRSFNSRLSGTTWVSRYRQGKISLDFTEARDSEWRRHQLGHMQVCTSLQTDNHASISLLSFLQTGCPSWPDNSHHCSSQFEFWPPQLHEHLHPHSACHLGNKTYRLTTTLHWPQYPH